MEPAPEGIVLSFMAAISVKITSIDPEINPGGVCLYRGCIPTKALLHVAKLKSEAENAGEMGLTFKTTELNVDKLEKWKNKVVEKLTGGLGQLVKSRKIRYLQGYAVFIDSETLSFKNEKGNQQKIRFKNAIIATGAQPVNLPGIEVDNKLIMNSAGSLNLSDVPSKLLIIGGGYIGLEMATIYHALNSEVSIAELTKSFMPGMDTDLVDTYNKIKGNIFNEEFLETKVTGIKKKEKKLQVEFEGKEEKFKREFDKVLVAVGQKPNSEDLGLEKAGIEKNDKGFINVNLQMQTSQKNIYAIGDVTGPPLLAHKASFEGRVAAEAIAGIKTGNDARVIPAVIYTEPEIAVCGLTELEANEKNINYNKMKFPWQASGRALTLNAGKGYTKLLIDPESERILGGAIIGTNAGDLIPELALAIEMAATASDVALTIHPHPTLSETIMEAAEAFYGHPAHIHTKK